MQSILVPGVNGFVGQHLARELSSNGLSVKGVGREQEVNPAIKAFVSDYQQCDLSSAEDVTKLNLSGIDGVINLAGIPQVGSSFGAKQEYYQTNVNSHILLISRLRTLGNRCRILAVSSGAVYSSDQPLPLTESSRLIYEDEGSPYAYSKVLLELALSERIKAGEDIIIARPFNHTGPGQGPGFIVPDISKQALFSDRIEIGPQNTRRDYTDVRDVVRAYRLLLDAGSLGENVFNICSGKSISRDEVLDMVLGEIGKKNAHIHPRSTLGRSNDPLELYGDHSRLTAITGWKPEIPLVQTIHDLILEMRQGHSS